MNKNSTILVGYYGGDDTHCLSAWTSTFEDLEISEESDINKRIAQLYQETVIHKKKTPEELLDMLAKEGHHTPFEKSMIHFIGTSDIASHIHKLKHRIATSINTESARYKELKEDRFYIPKDWPKEWQERLRVFSSYGNDLYHEALRELSPKLGRKRAKESARFFKGYNSQVVQDISFNFRSFMNFQRLRNDQASQLEIREIAEMMLEQVKAIPNNPFGMSLKAFGY